MAVMVNIRAWLSMLISEWWKLQCQDFFDTFKPLLNIFYSILYQLRIGGPARCLVKMQEALPKKAIVNQILINSFVVSYCTKWKPHSGKNLKEWLLECAALCIQFVHSKSSCKKIGLDLWIQTLWQHSVAGEHRPPSTRHALSPIAAFQITYLKPCRQLRLKINFFDVSLQHCYHHPPHTFGLPKWHRV